MTFAPEPLSTAGRSSAMQLRVNFKSGKPLHAQLEEQIRGAAASGILRAGEALPAIGALAGELRVNRNSVAKAYSELENLGIIELVPSKGYCLKEHHGPLRASVARVQAPETPDTRSAAPSRLRTAMTYSLLGFLLGALYFAVVAISGVVLVRAGLIRGENVAVLATVFIAILFWPLRSRVQEALDHILFRKRHELPAALSGLKLDFLSQKNLDAFLERVVLRTESFLGTRPELIRERSEVLAAVNTFPALRSARQPLTSGAELLMPLYSQDEVLGVLRIEGQPGRDRDQEDLEFLTAVGEQVATAANQYRVRSERAESEYALDIQRALLPSEIPQVAGFSISGAWQPARTVGGDYYDVFPLGDGKLALTVADVSGKGMAAALLMSNLQATTKAYAGTTSSPRELCAQVNRAITRSIASGKFITFFFGVLDAERRSFAYSNAGHNHPLLLSSDGQCQKLGAGGAVLGIFGEASYEEGEVALASGDQLVIFTDGIVEASDPAENEFGEERLIAVMQANAAASAPALRDSILQEVTHFCRGNFADDATLLTVVADGDNASRR